MSTRAWSLLVGVLVVAIATLCIALERDVDPDAPDVDGRENRRSDVRSAVGLDSAMAPVSKVSDSGSTSMRALVRDVDLVVEVSLASGEPCEGCDVLLSQLIRHRPVGIQST